MSLRVYNIGGQRATFNKEGFKYLVKEKCRREKITKAKAEQQLADLLGLSSDTVHKWNSTGGGPIDIQTVEDLAKALGLKNSDSLLNFITGGDSVERLSDRQKSAAKQIYDVCICFLDEFKRTNGFNDYWFETGTPSFLVKLLQENNYELNSLQGRKVSGLNLRAVDSMRTNPIPVLYQSGYLTISGYDEVLRKYILDYPNEEVERGFIDYLVPYYTSIEKGGRDSLLDEFIESVNAGEPEEFLIRLQAMLADNDYRVAGKKELYFQNVIYVVFKLLGFYAEVERATSRGRIDITIQTQDYIYILELKLDQKAEEALEQIKEKGYAQPFQRDSRKLFLIGVNFSSETRTVAEWVIEEKGAIR